MKQLPLFAFAALLLAGCGLLQPANLAETCAERYPCKDSLVIQEKVVTDTIEIFDTVIEYIDTTTCPDGTAIIDTLKITVPGKRVVVTRTVLDSTWYRQDSAYIAALAQRLNSAEGKNNTLAADLQQAKNLLENAGFKIPWWVYILGIVIVIFLGRYTKRTS